MSKMAENLLSTTLLNDGAEMPLFGLGMWKSRSGVGGEAEAAVVTALDAGYRLLDTAARYRNEADVGRGITKSGVRREDVFVVSKLWVENHGYHECMEAFKGTLNRLDLAYLDLYLIHAPFGGHILETYDAMLELKRQGLIRSVGVSNFSLDHLACLKESGRPVPAVNQVELHPYYRREELVEGCRKLGVSVMGYSPLVKGQVFADPTLISLSHRYNRSPAQVLIRWSVQNGYITIPKSANPHRIKENARVFDWSISEEDMQRMNTFPKVISSWDGTDAPWRA